MTSHLREHVPVEELTAEAFTIPTDRPESDGTISWNSTTLIVVHATAGGHRGLGYTYSSSAAARLIHDTLADVVQGADALDIPAAWQDMIRAVRNIGRPGIASMAIAAVDVSLWDLKSKLLDLPLVKLLGAARPAVPIYGSGGFTSYTIDQLREQLGDWAEQGIPRVKMKVGTDPAADLDRVLAARGAIGPRTELFVDANGAYTRKQALELAEGFAELDVNWFEEPVSADDLEGLRLLRDRVPKGMEIAAGEYGFDAIYFRRMLEAGAVDVLQADATRCAGITGFLEAADLCLAFGLELSAHCAPALHVHPACSVLPMRHVEYFHDHVRIEKMLFDGTPTPAGGTLTPNLARPGMGLEFKRADARRFAI